MILSSSSEDGIAVPLVPVKHCPNFFKQKSEVHAQIHLLQTLQSELKCTVDVTVTLATALYHGNFTWDRADSPKCFCSLLSGKPSPLAASEAKEATMLHLKASKWGGWSDKDIERAIKQSIIIPITIGSMIHNLKKYAGVSLIFFGELSLFTIGLQSWRSHISSNLLVYESLAASDREFIYQVLTTIDTRVNFWLEE